VRSLVLLQAVIVAIPWVQAFWFGPSVPAVSWMVTATAGVLAMMLRVSSSRTHPFAWTVESDPRCAKVLRNAMLIAAIVSALIGYLQFVGWAQYVPWLIYPSETQEVYANLRQRNQFASLIVMGWVALGCGLIWFFDTWNPSTSEGTAAVDFRKVMLLLFIMLLLTWAVAVSGSRTGVLQWLLLSGLMGWWAWPKKSQPRQMARHGWLITGVIALLVWIALMPTLAEAVGNPNARGLIGRIGAEGSWSRMALWLNTLGLIAQNPWLGWGIGELAYAHYSTSFAPGSMMAIEHPWAVSAGRFMEMPDNAHNLILHMAFVWGVPLSLAGVALMGWLIWRGAPWRELDPMRQMAWGILLVIGIQSMLEYPLWYGPFFMTAVMCVGILWSPRFLTPALTKETLTHTVAIRIAVTSVALVALGVLAYLAYDYHRVSQPYLQPHERSARYASDPYGHASKTLLFQGHAQFAELVIMPLPSTQRLSRAQTERMYALASGLMRFSPEPRVIERLIESSVVLGKDDVAAFHIARYREAWPQNYAKWRALGAVS
jgi:hypothetical protein